MSITIIKIIIIIIIIIIIVIMLSQRLMTAAQWRRVASMMFVMIDRGNTLSFGQRQAINRTETIPTVFVISLAPQRFKVKFRWVIFKLI